MRGYLLASLLIAFFSFQNEASQAEESACSGSGGSFSFVAFGDMPYRLPEDDARFRQLIQAINGRAPAFSVHVGDIKSGGTPCSDASFLRIKAHFDAVDGPLIYTPGDNEWTDCHRKRAGPMDPLERLGALRSLFFASDLSLGKHPIVLESQPSAGGPPLYVENRRWQHGGVHFVTAHVIGSNNNRDRRRPSAMAEFKARDAATAEWIGEGFEQAIEQLAKALVLIIHADPFEGGDGESFLPKRSGFRRTLDVIGAQSLAFGQPVLLIHGDFHTYKIDKPFRDLDGDVIQTITRLEVPGSKTIKAVEVTVKPRKSGAFLIQVIRRQSVKVSHPSRHDQMSTRRPSSEER